MNTFLVCPGWKLLIDRIFISIFSQVFCSTDRWYGLTMEDIRAIEDQTKEELDKARQVGEVRGMRADAD